MRRWGVLLLVVAGLGVPAGAALAHPEPGDVDGDGVGDQVDNCPQERNGDQQNTDRDLVGGDALGDRCDTDADADDWPNPVPYYHRGGQGMDNCPLVPNPGQEPAPAPNSKYGAACAVDTDGDGPIDPEDNCPEVANPDQADYDYDDTGDVCDPDDDEDGEFDAVDNCPQTYNYDQVDADGDGLGAACDDDDKPRAPPAQPTPGASASPPPDQTRPKVAVSVARTLRLREHGRSIAVKVRCSEQCTIAATLRVKRKRVAAGGGWLGGQGTTYVFLRRLRRVAPAKATLRLTATDAAGNVATASRRVRLRR